MTSLVSDGTVRAPVVTATRPRSQSMVEIDLDGARWRVVPLAAAARAGITNGVVLDRQRARTLNRALRAERALASAVRILRYGDQSRATLDTKLELRGVASRDRERAVEMLVTARVVDDARFARSRAAALASRGHGDAAIRHDLEERGLEGAALEDALSELAPEPERVAVIVARRGASRSTLAYLGRRGFSEDALEAIVAGIESEGLG